MQAALQDSTKYLEPTDLISQWCLRASNDLEHTKPVHCRGLDSLVLQQRMPFTRLLMMCIRQIDVLRSHVNNIHATWPHFSPGRSHFLA